MYRVLLMVLLGMLLGGCGVDWFPEVPVAVSDFAFTPTTGVTAGSTQTSNAVTVAFASGTSAQISVTGGEYNIDGGSFTAEPGKVKSGQVVSVRHTAASGAGETTSTTLTIGDKSAIFSSTTMPLTATAFSFSPAGTPNVTAGAEQKSSIVTVALSGGTEAPISVTGGEYSINGGTFTATAGKVSNGATVQVRHTAAASGAADPTVTTTLTIADKSATFATSTANVVGQTIDVSYSVTSSDTATGHAALALKPGSYTIQFVSSSNGTGGYGYTQAEVTSSPLTYDQTKTFANGDAIWFSDFIPDVIGKVYTTIIKIDGVPITFRVTATK